MAQAITIQIDGAEFVGYRPILDRIARDRHERLNAHTGPVEWLRRSMAEANYIGWRAAKDLTPWSPKADRLMAEKAAA